MSVSFSDSGKKLVEGFVDLAQAAIEFSADLKTLGKSAQELQTAMTFKAAADGPCNCSEKPEDVQKNIHQLNKEAQTRSQNANATLKTLEAKYKNKVSQLWANPNDTRASPEPSPEKPAEASPREIAPPSSPAQDEMASKTDGDNNGILDRISNDAVDQGTEKAEEIIATAVTITKEIGDEASELGAQAGNKLSRWIDGIVPAKAKAVTCLIPSPWTLGACMAFGIAGLNTSVEDFKENPNLENFGRILMSSAKIGFSAVRMTRLAGSSGEVGYNVAASSSGDNGVPDFSIPPGEDGLTPEDEEVFTEMQNNPGLAVETIDLFAAEHPGGFLLQKFYYDFELYDIVPGDHATIENANAYLFRGIIDAHYDLDTLVVNLLRETHNGCTFNMSYDAFDINEINALRRLMEQNPQTLVVEIFSRYPGLKEKLNAVINYARNTLEGPIRPGRN